MELLIFLIVISVVRSVIDSNKAKKQSEERKAQSAKTQPSNVSTSQSKPKQEEVFTIEELWGSFTKKVDETVGKTEQTKPAQQKKKKPNPNSSSKKPKASYTPKEQQTAKAAAATPLETKHTPPKPSVKPLQVAYDNQVTCDHRVELNQNIQYSAKKKEEVVKPEITVAQQSIINGIIWDEILAKPKAYRNR